MKRYFKEVTMALMFVTILYVGTLSVALDVRAQDKGGTLAQRIQGSWILVSIYNDQDGKKTEVLVPIREAP